MTARRIAPAPTRQVRPAFDAHPVKSIGVNACKFVPSTSLFVDHIGLELLCQADEVERIDEVL